MKLSIGILAHNEERLIGRTIGSLLGQTVVRDGAIEKEIIVVANGCADGTVEAARAALGAVRPEWRCRSEVRDVNEPGKANAWNVFVHEASAADSDFLVLLDADIEFATDDAVARLLAHLEASPEVAIAPDQPVKKFEGAGPTALLIRAMQKTGSDGDSALSGQLYAAHADALRAVVMPRGVVVEDGFLRGMVLTHGFSAPEDVSRIRRAPGVRHYYAPYETLSAIYRYERRQAAGTTINRFLFQEVSNWRRQGLDPSGEIRRRNREQPDWLEALIADRLKTAGIVSTPKNYVLRRMRKGENWTAKRLLKAPLIAAATVFDFVVALDASRQLRDRARGVRWDAIRQ